MMKRIVSIVFILLLGLSMQAQVNVRLHGHGDNLAQRTLELYCYTDMLTMTEQLLDSDVADSNGDFELGCYIKYPRLVFVQIENYSQSFYIEPGRTYEIYLPTFQWEQDEERNIFLDPVALPLQFLNLPADELNLRILQFDTLADTFLSQNRVYFAPQFHPDRRWMDSLEAYLHPLLPTDSSDFFFRYATYTLAEMRFAMRFASRSKMFERYLLQTPVLYHDENFMRLLFSLTDGMISLGTKKLPKWLLTEWVEAANLSLFLDSLGTDPLLADEQLRELAALTALKECYYDADYSREGVRKMVQQLGAQSKWDEHRQLATWLEASFHRAEQGEEVETNFELPDVEHRLVNLDSLRGKWIYISFVRVGDPNCTRELETMAHFRDSVYALGNVEMVSICCDREFQKMYHLLRNNKRGARYRWLWLHFDGNYRLLERMGVVSYPTFLLINPEGKVHYSVTPSPEDGIFIHAPWTPEKEPERSDLPFLRQD